MPDGDEDREPIGGDHGAEPPRGHPTDRGPDTAEVPDREAPGGEARAPGGEAGAEVVAVTRPQSTARPDDGSGEAPERGSPPEGTARDGEGSPLGRRLVLGMVGLGVAGIAFGAHVQDALTRLLAPVEEHDPTGLTGLIPLGGFRFYSVTGSVPTPTEKSYRLAVGGMVRTPLTLSLDDLRSFPQTNLVRDFQCVTGWRVPDVHWSGVRLSELLERAGVRPGAKALVFRSFDGTYTESLTLSQAGRPDMIAALSMLGGPVTHDHGGPVRLYAAPMYGYKSLKWLSGIDVVDRVEPGYWEQNGYDVDGWVGASNGRQDSPT